MICTKKLRGAALESAKTGEWRISAAENRATECLYLLSTLPYKTWVGFWRSVGFMAVRPTQDEQRAWFAKLAHRNSSYLMFIWHLLAKLVQDDRMGVPEECKEHRVP